MLVEPQLHEPLTYPSHPVLLAESNPRPSTDSTAFISLSSIPSTIDLEKPEDFAEFISGYPTLHGCQLGRISGSSAARGRTRASISVELSWTGPAALKWLAQARTEYRKSLVVLPSAGPSHNTMHPLMIWWSLLFSLSMLARYEPRSWTRVIDVNNSPHAVPIEYLLEVAADSVPDLLADTLDNMLKFRP